jgi:hypothetical protein
MAILYRLMSGATEGEAQGQPLRSAGRARGVCDVERTGSYACPEAGTREELKGSAASPEGRFKVVHLESRLTSTNWLLVNWVVSAVFPTPPSPSIVRRWSTGSGKGPIGSRVYQPSEILGGDYQVQRTDCHLAMKGRRWVACRKREIG